MNENLKVVWGQIVDSKSSSKWVELADYYIELYNKNPKIFMLPTAHSMLSEVVQQYHNDVVGFTEFVRSVRDAVEEPNKQEIHTHYRKLTSRAGQQIRRSRLTKAVSLIEEHVNLNFNKQQRDAVGVWLTQYWGKERMDLFNSERMSYPNKRVPTETRAEIYEQFWEDVDAGLSNGLVPIPPEIVYGKLASLESH